MSQIGAVYGQALYDLAKEEGRSLPVLRELCVLKDSFSREPEFLRLLGAPNLPKEERCGILDDCFRGKVDPYVLNFMKLLTERGAMRAFGQCCDTYRELYNTDNGILEVKAVTAVALSDEQKDRLTRKLEQLTGKTVELQNRVDPSCLGGVRLDYDGKRVDDTVQHRLADIRSLLKNTVL